MMLEQNGMTIGEALGLAEQYAARGIPTFPIAISWDDGKQKTGKRPLTPHGHLDASTDIKRIRGMFNGHPTMRPGEVLGVGIHLGPAGLFALDADIDTRGDGVAELAAILDRHGIRDTVRTVSASGGSHTWLTKGTRHVTNASPYDAIDIRGDEGWVVAPGTVTPWGEWSFDPEHDLFDGAPIANAPESLLAEIGATDGPAQRGTPSGPGSRAVPHDLDPRDRAALTALEALGGTYSHRDATSIHVTRPGKIAGTSATIGHIGPGVVKVFTSNWRPLEAERRYDADELLQIARDALQGPPVDDNGDPQPTGLAVFYIDWPTFWDTDTQTDDWLIKPMIARGRGHALYAGAKTGKSWLMLEVAAAAATGRPILHEPPRPPIHVLYIDYEMTASDVKDRLETFGYSDTDDLTHLHYALLPSIPRLDTTEGGAVVLQAAQACEAELVVIDTTARAVTGEENDANVYKAFYAHTGMPLKAAGIAWARLDHAGKDATKGQRGSSAKNDDVDVVWRLERRDQKGLRMVATHKRMQWVPDQFDLNSKETDLGTQLVTDEPTWPTGTHDIMVPFLDRLEVPTSAGRPAVRKLMLEHGVTARNEAIHAAIAFRRQREKAVPEDLLGHPDGGEKLSPESRGHDYLKHPPGQSGDSNPTTQAPQGGDSSGDSGDSGSNVSGHAHVSHVVDTCCPTVETDPPHLTPETSETITELIEEYGL
jgi:hypothetical protein